MKTFEINCLVEIVNTSFVLAKITDSEPFSQFRIDEFRKRCLERYQNYSLSFTYVITEKTRL